MPALADVLGRETATKLMKKHPSYVLSIRASVIRAALPALQELLGSRQAAAAVETYPTLLHSKAITLRAAMPALVDVLGPQARTLTVAFAAGHAPVHLASDEGMCLFTAGEPLEAYYRRG